MTQLNGIALLLWIVIGAVLCGAIGAIVAFILYFVGKMLVEDLIGWIGN